MNLFLLILAHADASRYVAGIAVMSIHAPGNGPGHAHKEVWREKQYLHRAKRKQQQPDYFAKRTKDWVAHHRTYVQMYQHAYYERNREKIWAQRRRKKAEKEREVE